jgi:hypothetical protein
VHKSVVHSTSRMSPPSTYNLASEDMTWLWRP